MTGAEIKTRLDLSLSNSNFNSPHVGRICFRVSGCNYSPEQPYQ